MRATGMKSPTENESCSTCGRSEFRFGSPNSMTGPSAALLSTYSAPTTPPPPVRITEIIGWPKWGSAAVVMMLAWSTCEPPNGYGVTNCSSLSGNALAALVSAKAAAAVVASEVIDRRGGMISLFATTFLRAPRHPRRLALRDRRVPSLEVGDGLDPLRCCHAVLPVTRARTDHVPFATTLPIPTARHASQRPETRLPRTTADFRTWPRRCAPRFPAAPEIQAPIHRAEI